ncbi:MAG TPA: redoxin family protein [Azospirillaceae bacterium]|nr:redoxin family protein [Azospirillaceae bacterium]
MTQDRLRKAPEISTIRWFNTPTPLSLAALRGRVVLLHAFQMLCPGCVQMALPQAQRHLHETFPRDEVAVVGLHSVFEHHDAMTPVSLEAFLHEYRLTFPVGVDAPGAQGPIPLTMSAYAMQGTPTLVLIDREGRIRRQRFGHVPDLLLGADIAALLREPAAPSLPVQAAAGAGCADGVCAAPA